MAKSTERAASAGLAVHVARNKDEVEEDVSHQAWTLTFQEAVAAAQVTEVEGVRVPSIGLNDLITSKSAYREQDQIDVASLRDLASMKGISPF